ncbi:MAG: LysE family transporter [Rhodobiaceae bacterium]|nr:LysE family transporter [Rhodobiaceae bacterium]
MSLVLTFAGVFAIFIPALLLPGPDFVAVVRSAMTRGARAGIGTTCGVTLGLGMYAALSLLGLSAVLTEFRWLAVAIRVLGGCYLAYLGIRLLLARHDDLESAGLSARQTGNPFVFGFLVTLTNPKAIVLFASVFATAVTHETPVWFMALMVAAVMASALVWYTTVSVFMASGPVMRRFGAARRWIEKAAGACFVAIGGRILLDARNPVTP